MRVFINGGAGGVGTYAIQVARALGAEVSATCSALKGEILRELGARPIEYNAGDPFAERGGYDVVLNCVRGPSLSPLRGLLRAGGVLVTVTGTPAEMLEAKARNLVSSQRTVVFMVKTSGALLDGLCALIDAGKVKPLVERPTLGTLSQRRTAELRQAE